MKEYQVVFTEGNGKIKHWTHLWAKSPQEAKRIHEEAATEIGRPCTVNEVYEMTWSGTRGDRVL